MASTIRYVWSIAVMIILLAGVGVILASLLAYCVARFLYALLSRCDTETARARMPSDAFKGKIVWVTGASSGIGREMALALGRQGARLVLSARDASALEKVREQILQAAGSERAAGAAAVKLLQADLVNLESLPALADEAVAAFDGLDVLVNNAGVSQRSLGADSAFDVDQYICTLNYLAKVRLTKCVLGRLAERRGTIVNVSSAAGKFGTPLRTAYCASKHAVIGFFDALRVEEAARGTGIRVTNACPGSVRTDVSRNALVASAGEKRGQSDVNIEAGLEAGFVADRILAAASVGVREVWIAPPKELFALYLNQYFPGLLKTLMAKTAKTLIERTLAGMPEQEAKEDKKGK